VYQLVYIIHDCDPTLFYFYRDVDDSLALGYELRKYFGDYELIGVTTVYGNNSVDKTYETAKLIVKKSGREIPVYKGAESANDLGIKNEAVEFMINKAKEFGEIVILATGPLTNVASAFLLEDQMVDYVKELIIMGGAIFTKGNVPIVNAEFNFWKDPKAAKIIIENAKNVVLTPLDITKKVRWGKEIIKLLEEKDDELAKFLAEGARKWATFWSILGGFHPHDVISAVYPIRREIYKAEKVRISIDNKGRVLKEEDGKEVLVLLDLDKEEFLNEFLSAFEK